MLKIKLARTGRKNQPHFRVVVAEDRSKVTGKNVSTLGHYHPRQSQDQLKIDLDQYRHWLTQGAKPTDTIRKLVKKLS